MARSRPEALSIGQFHARVATGARPSVASVRFAVAGEPITLPGTRTAQFIFSDGSADRYGDTISAKGWQLDNYSKNPVVLFGHDSASIDAVIGRATSVRVEGDQLVGDIEFMDGAINPKAETVYQMVKGGFLNTVSVGFQPLEYSPTKDRARPVGGIDFKRQELLEVSIVPIPANPNAVVQARAAGIEVDRLRFRRGVPDMTVARAATPTASAAARTSVSTQLRIAEARSYRTDGFATMGDFLITVARSASPTFPVDARLVRAPMGLNEADPSTGGFLVPVEYTETLIGGLYDTAALLPLCDRRETSVPGGTKIPAIDETSRVDGSRHGGAVSYWAAEAASVSATFPRYRMLEFAPKKLISVSIATGELLADVPMLDGYMRSAFASEAAFMVDRAILTGSGAGQPLGILNSSALITVAKSTGQAAATLTPENVESMWSRLPAPCRRRAVWLVNEDMESNLDAMLTVVGTAGGPAPDALRLYMVPDGYGGAAPTLKGRPVVAIEQASALGTVGDITLADLSQYIVVDAGMASRLSLDVRFLTDEAVFRFVLRIDGAPAWASPVTSYNGTGTRSPFVALATRA